MHVLHRPHPHRAVTITAIAAVLAIAVSLILATAVSDLHGSSSGLLAPSVNVPAVHGQGVGHVWNGNPFARLLRTPVAAPWTERPSVPAG